MLSIFIKCSLFSRENQYGKFTFLGDTVVLPPNYLFLLNAYMALILRVYIIPNETRRACKPLYNIPKATDRAIILL